MRSKFNADNNLKAEFEFETQGSAQNAVPLSHDSVRTKLIVDHVPLIKFITSQIIVRLPSNIDQKDLFSAGMIGLMDAIEKYDPTRDNKFKTYAEFRIRGAILDELRSQDWLPRSAREIYKKEKLAQTTLEQKLGRRPSSQEVADYLEISMDEYQSQISRMNVSLVSLDELSEQTRYEDKLSIEGFDKMWAQNPFVLLKAKGLRILVAKSLNELHHKQRLVLEMYYYKDLSLKEIGNLLNLTESRVSQLHTTAISKLKKKLKDVLTE